MQSRNHSRHNRNEKLIKAVKDEDEKTVVREIL